MNEEQYVNIRLVLEVLAAERLLALGLADKGQVAAAPVGHLGAARQGAHLVKPAPFHTL
jgi:hypothetical protein